MQIYQVILKYRCAPFIICASLHLIHLLQQIFYCLSIPFIFFSVSFIMVYPFLLATLILQHLFFLLSSPFYYILKRFYFALYGFYFLFIHILQHLFSFLSSPYQYILVQWAQIVINAQNRPIERFLFSTLLTLPELNKNARKAQFCSKKCYYRILQATYKPLKTALFRLPKIRNADQSHHKGIIRFQK